MKPTTKFTRISFLCFLYLIGIVSCTEKREIDDNTEGVNSIKIDVSEIKELKYSSLFEKDTLVFLNSDNLLSSISKLELINDSIAILKFTKGFDGLLIKNLKNGDEVVINQLGKGPNEFSRITNFIYSGHNQSIYILDAGSSKILQFDLKGNFKKYWKSDYLNGAQSVKHLGDNNFAVYAGNFYYGEVDFQLIYLNLDTGEILHKFIEIDPNRAKFMLFFGEDNFNHSNNLFTAAHNNVLYELKSDAIIPKYYVSFGEQDIPEAVYNQKHADVRAYFGKLQDSNYPYGVANISQSGNWLSFSFNYNSGKVGAFYNLETKKAILYDKINNDVFGLPISKDLSYSDLPLTINKNNVIFTLEPNDQLANLAEMKKELSPQAYDQFKRANLKMITLLEKMGPESNPVLVILSIKGI